MQTGASKKNTFFQALLIIQTIALLVYTGFAFKNEGLTLFQVIISNISSLNWSGQFNLDFACYLALSGIWIMWRNKFTTSSIIIAIVAMILGIIFFAPYLLYLLTKEKGDIKLVLCGDR
jgi:hypothetical protein